MPFYNALAHMRNRTSSTFVDAFPSHISHPVPGSFEPFGNVLIKKTHTRDKLGGETAPKIAFDSQVVYFRWAPAY